MAGVEGHRFVRRAPKGLCGRIRGQVYSCSCGAMRMSGGLVDAISWHAEHVRTLPDERAQRLAALQQEIAEIETQLAALTGT